LPLLISLNLLALSATASVAEETASQNPFQEALTIGAMGVPIIATGEDLSSPFANAHLIEQESYKAQYNGQYGIAAAYETRRPSAADGSTSSRMVAIWNDGTEGPEPIDRRVPNPVDAQGKPLWLDGDQGQQALHYMVSELFGRAKTSELDRLFNDWSDTGIRMADGRWRLASYETGLKNLFAPGANWEMTYKVIADWRKNAPQSRAAAFAEAIYWLQYGWMARGGGYAGSVTDDGWRLFHERLEKGQAVLLEAEAYAANSPLWGRVMVEIGTGLGWPRENLLAAAREAAAREKSYAQIYTATVNALTPKWGGDWKLVDAYIRDVEGNSAAVAGHEFYTRLYLFIAEFSSPELDLFRDTPAQWPAMKAGFEDMMRNYPHSGGNLNLFAAYACVAGDRDTFRRVRFQLGDQANAARWPSNHSLDLCDHKYGAPRI
jgi:hypothetical protein